MITMDYASSSQTGVRVQTRVLRLRSRSTFMMEGRCKHSIYVQFALFADSILCH